MTIEPSPEGPHLSTPEATRRVEAAPLETLAYTFALDVCDDSTRALALARDLLKDVRKSGLRSPAADALLRRLALAAWVKRDRPRPRRLESKNPKESAVLLFFRTSWSVTYDDLGAILSVSEDRSRHQVHKARMEQIGTLTRIPIPGPACRRPRELLSDYREGSLSEPLADDVTEHLRECRECSFLDDRLQSLLLAPPKPFAEAPLELIAPGVTRPALSFSLDGVSRAKRRAGLALLFVGLALGVIELHPGLNAAASAQMDRAGATLSRWRSRGERLMEDLRVLKALAIGTVEGRTEELSQTLDDYVNADPLPDDGAQNKAEPDAVLNPRDPQTSPLDQNPQSPENGLPSPEKP